MILIGNEYVCDEVSTSIFLSRTYIDKYFDIIEKGLVIPKYVAVEGLK